MATAVKTLPMAIKDFFGVDVKAVKEFIQSLSDEDKAEFRSWFRENGYPDVS